MKNNLLWALIVLIAVFSSCEPNDDNHVPQDLAVKNFVWKGMNLYYLWQPQVPDLADERFEDQNQLNAYLRNQPEPIALFNNLRIDPTIDRFSVIYSDYTILEGILSGTTKNNGVDFGLRFKPGSTTQIYGWVRYILPNSDAAGKDIARGDLFYAVNGQPLTTGNYRSLLSTESYTLNLADYDNGNLTPNGRSVFLTKTVISENPVYQAKILQEGGKTIAYLMYNGFYQQYEDQLNAAFAYFKSMGAQELVLDLRYNSGGSIATATRLASMITGQFSGQLFAREQWNPKVQQYLQDSGNGALQNNFTNTLGNGATINSLQLNKVYVLTTRASASASELVINCLKPYVNVVQIGETTTGKNVGSVTLYDSVNFRKEGANPSHKYAMQPIVLRLVNKNGTGEYDLGISPDHFLAENPENLGELGRIDEPLLATALSLITGSGRNAFPSPSQDARHFSDVKALDGRDEMFRESFPLR
jgi:carboxyl-terminal processing protease